MCGKRCEPKKKRQVKSARKAMKFDLNEISTTIDWATPNRNFFAGFCFICSEHKRIAHTFHGISSFIHPNNPTRGLNTIHHRPPSSASAPICPCLCRVRPTNKHQLEKRESTRLVQFLQIPQQTDVIVHSDAGDDHLPVHVQMKRSSCKQQEENE